MNEVNYRSVEVYYFETQADIPNHPELPVLVYSGVLDPSCDAGREFQRTFSENKWGGFQRRRLSATCHFHLQVHEAVGVTCGTATVELGGSGGKALELNRGDLLLLPAGTGHRLIAASPNFQAVSAYPEDQLGCGPFSGTPLPPERVAHIVQLTPRPTTDPFFGRKGPVFDFWYEWKILSDIQDGVPVD